MALGDPYATLDELKAHLGIALTDTADDAVLTRALGAVSRQGIEKFCHRQFNDAGTPSARVYRPDRHRLALVDDFSTDTGLVVEVDTGDTGTYDTTLTSADYVLEPLNGVVDGESGWPYWRILAVNTWWPLGHVHPSVRVTARWGWAAVPDPVKQACLLLAAEMGKLKDAPFGVLGFADYGPVRVRNNPIATQLLVPYVRDPVLVA